MNDVLLRPYEDPSLHEDTEPVGTSVDFVPPALPDLDNVVDETRGRADDLDEADAFELESDTEGQDALNRRLALHEEMDATPNEGAGNFYGHYKKGAWTDGMGW